MPAKGGRSGSTRRRATILLVYLIAFISMVFFYMVPVQIPFLVAAIGIEQNSLAGLAIIAMSFTAAITSFNYHRFKAKLSFAGVYALALGLLGIGYLVTWLSRGYGTLILGMFLAGLGVGLKMPNANLWLMSLAPPMFRGRLIGGLTTCVFLGQFFSPVLVHPASAFTSLHGAFGIAGGLLIVLALCFGLGGRVLKKEKFS
jgi:MFS family permease